MTEPTAVRHETAIPEEVRDLLQGQEICVLATVFVDIPHLSLMGYSVSHDCRRLYMATEAGTKKVANIRRNPNVAVLMDTRQAAMDGGRGQALTVKGLCRVLPEGRERDKALAELGERGYLQELLKGSDVAVLEVEAVSFHLVRGTHDSMFVTLK